VKRIVKPAKDPFAVETFSKIFDMNAKRLTGGD
jgi:hypothetical protein